MPTFREYHFHLPHYHVDHDRDLKLLFGSHLIFTTLGSLIFFFFPLFLFQFSQVMPLAFLSDYSPLQQGLILIAFYYALMRVVALLTTIPIANLLAHQGTRFCLLFAHVLFILKLVLLTQVTFYPELIFLTAVIQGVFINAYWMSYHLMMTQKTHVTNLGKDLGLLQFMVEFCKMLTPAIGGLIIVTLGYSILFASGILLLLLSLMLVLSFKTNRLVQEVTLAEVKNLMVNPSFSRHIFTFGGRYLNDAIITLWPLYVFLFLGAIDKVGYLYSLSLLLALVLSLITGAYIDKAKSKTGFYVSGGMLGAVWLSRLAAFTPITIALTDTLDKLIAPVTWLFYDTLLFKAARGKSTLLFFTTREISISLWAIGLWTAVGIIFMVIDSAWQALFILAAIGVLLSLLMTDTFTYGKTKK
ncbi:MAG TPA: hypothetical protein VF209_05440 [Patescibacteria group bacterium]